MNQLPLMSDTSQPPTLQTPSTEDLIQVWVWVCRSRKETTSIILPSYNDCITTQKQAKWDRLACDGIHRGRVH